jgi:hypothetical protein
MPDRPREMHIEGRPSDPTFETDEIFFHRVHPDRVQDGDTVDPLHVQCPDLSSNRQRYSEPWYVLYPRAKFGNYAVFRFLRTEVLPEVESPQTGGGSPTVYTVQTIHDPEPDNYGHCETRLYRGLEHMRPNKVSSGAKKIFREHMSRILKLERNPGIPFPPCTESR